MTTPRGGGYEVIGHCPDTSLSIDFLSYLCPAQVQGFPCQCCEKLSMQSGLQPADSEVSLVQKHSRSGLGLGEGIKKSEEKLRPGCKINE